MNIDAKILNEMLMSWIQLKRSYTLIKWDTFWDTFQGYTLLFKGYDKPLGEFFKCFIS